MGVLSNWLARLIVAQVLIAWGFESLHTHFNLNQFVKNFSLTIELFKKYNIFNKKDNTMQNLNNILLNARTEGDNPCVSEKMC